MLLLVIVQFGVYFHLRAVAQTAARHGLDQVRVVDGSTDAGDRRRQRVPRPERQQPRGPRRHRRPHRVAVDGDRVRARSCRSSPASTCTSRSPSTHRPSESRHEPAGACETTDGSASVELAILAPLVGILLACVVLVGRVQIARADSKAPPARRPASCRSPATHTPRSATSQPSARRDTRRRLTVVPDDDVHADHHGDDGDGDASPASSTSKPQRCCPCPAR